MNEKTPPRKKPLFSPGRIVATPGAIEALDADDVRSALARHLSGDWGDVCSKDAKENEFSLTRRLRLFSVYHGSDGTRFWVITEADRSVTTILLPSEY